MADAAEKEASEVLHSLLSVERIEKQEKINEEDQSPTYQNNSVKTDESEQTLQWHTPVQLATHSLFSTIDGNTHFAHTMDDHQVIWEGPALQVDNKYVYTTTTEVIDEDEEQFPNKTLDKQKTTPKMNENKKKTLIKKRKKLDNSNHNDPTKLEESSAQVKERFKRGCECQDESCFRGLNPDNVYKHRLNIAELTKGEHDMYLMGVTMACLANPDTTVRHKERRRLRAQYVYQGRRVCLDAFLYLENCTHYQLKRIRKHVMTHGVAPRIHGNHGKKPHNTFSLDIYKHATDFLKQYLEQHTGDRDTKQPIQLPWDVTRKNLHDAYKEYSLILDPNAKLMGYSTFRHFMKEQFPHVKFCKIEPKASTSNSNQQQQKQQTIERDQQIKKCEDNNIQQVIPLVVDATATQHHQQAFLVQQLIPNGSISAEQHTTANTFSYQLTNTGYVINEQGNIVTTMTNTQHQAPYTFNRM